MSQDNDITLTRTFEAPVFAQALRAWDWLQLDDLEPLLANCFGDIFLTGQDGVYLLDVATGEVEHTFDSVEQAKQRLSTEAGMDEFLLADLVFEADAVGLRPAPGQVFAYLIPPVVGGEFDVANLEVRDFVEAVTVAGRLHEALAEFDDDDEVSNQVLVDLGYPACRDLE